MKLHLYLIEPVMHAKDDRDRLLVVTLGPVQTLSWTINVKTLGLPPGIQ